jgi:HK97 family phage major capsid protein
MSKIIEMRQARTKAWEEAKSFLNECTDKDGKLSAEDAQTYDRMEAEVVALGNDIKRLERQAALNAEMSKPTDNILTGKPGEVGNDFGIGAGGKSGTSTKKDSPFIRALRYIKTNPQNALSEGIDLQGGYTVPEEFGTTLIALRDELLFVRRRASQINISTNVIKMPMVASLGAASYIGEGVDFTETDPTFGQVEISIFKLGQILLPTWELLEDNSVNLERWLRENLAKVLAAKEEQEFLMGVGGDAAIPGIFPNADIGVTTAGTAITSDNLLDLIGSVPAAYRRAACWMMNDATVTSVRKLKDSNGQYIWQASLEAGTPDRLLGYPIESSSVIPTIAAGANVVAFGDLSCYQIADRHGIEIMALREKYAPQGKLGLLGYERTGGGLTDKNGIKVLQIAGG